MSDEKSYTISQIAKEFDITTRTIRFYEDQGLISPSRIKQQRIYTERERVLLKLILRGKRLGFSLNEAKELFEMYDPETGNVKQLKAMLIKLEEKKAALEQQFKDIEIMQLELNSAEEKIIAALQYTETAAEAAS